MSKASSSLGEQPFGIYKMAPGSGGNYGMKFVTTSKHATHQSTPDNVVVQSNRYLTTVCQVLVGTSNRIESYLLAGIGQWKFEKDGTGDLYTIQSGPISKDYTKPEAGTNKAGDKVLAGSHSFKWTIKETDTENHYHKIYLDSKATVPLVWYIADGKDGASVMLADSSKVSAEWILESIPDSGTPQSVSIGSGGKYRLKFVTTSKHASHKSASNDSVVQSSSDNTKWNFTKVSGGDDLFTIQSTASSKYARPETKAGDKIVAGSDSFKWTVTETDTDKHYYKIYLDPKATVPLVWYLADDKDGTNVTLGDASKVSAEWILEEIPTKLLKAHDIKSS
ncbi:hypothetical protein SERLA73DRAFT_177954 [Serpula lacrymans var. lacrymans S7.3]|uniref:Ricin B lectin domain-containing protein n=2 Tax=Serpula lacrymans var. lacrymans TaxID=341189 RepID=F8PPZ6_SERL3|nr:uncharacterized protein SERLADRAFT_461824 [Serpula lacrymans var. lacrymans S7.9]EGO02150.1 hypothetical protein SERLA73DRAFT_177954 [Serpula lacrymans var. lacrymans S7.3]EGO27774.1 hypothetical protein SERLADRAFT_461824 [Serpula lacrymans var. lacrymans S7.9]